MATIVGALKDLTPLLQTMVWVGMLCVAALVFRKELRVVRDAVVQRAEGGGSIELGPVRLGELRRELTAVRSQVDEIGRQVTQLFLATMSPPMLFNLQKLASGRFGQFEMNAGLRRELYHLRDIGYVHVVAVRGIPDSGTDLSEYVRVTPAGQEFVRLRGQLEQAT